MTLDALRARVAAVVARIELRGWPWRIVLGTVHCGDEVLSIQEHVRDRDSGEPTTLGRMPYGLPPADDDATLVAWIYRQIQKHVLHELAEAFHVDGERVHDPHRADAAAASALDALEDALAVEPAVDEYLHRSTAPISFGAVRGAAGVCTTLSYAPRGEYLTPEEIARFADLPDGEEE